MRKIEAVAYRGPNSLDRILAVDQAETGWLHGLRGNSMLLPIEARIRSIAVRGKLAARPIGEIGGFGLGVDTKKPGRT